MKVSVLYESWDFLPSTPLHYTPQQAPAAPIPPPAVNSPGLLHAQLRAFLSACLLLEMVFLPDILRFMEPEYYSLSEIFLGHVNYKGSHALHFMNPFSAFLFSF